LFQRLVPPLLVLLLAAAPLGAQEPNRNVRFGMPAPAKADPGSREASVDSGSCVRCPVA
jgi:hypothetical protein